MDLRGSNTVVIDIETAQSADDCRHCGESLSSHTSPEFPLSTLCPSPTDPAWTCYERIGWDNHAALGLSLGCCYWYANDRYTFFDAQTLPALIEQLLVENPQLITFNGLQFDCPLMAAVAELHDEDLTAWTQYYQRESYDVLNEIWQADPTRKFERGLNSLDALSKANGLGAKEMDGATAPVLWRQGRYAEVATYNLGDVWRTKRLFEQVVETGQLIRGDGKPITLPRPVIR